MITGGLPESPRGLCLVRAKTVGLWGNLLIAHRHLLILAQGGGIKNTRVYGAFAHSKHPEEWIDKAPYVILRFAARLYHIALVFVY
ncbi:MAG: hypothetical protein ACR2PR_11305, partial [Pseudohongiellaceae bacterium]